MAGNLLSLHGPPWGPTEELIHDMDPGLSSPSHTLFNLLSLPKLPMNLYSCKLTSQQPIPRSCPDKLNDRSTLTEPDPILTTPHKESTESSQQLREEGALMITYIL